ncbi:c-type cytochrome [Flaviaesturariibacter aridisoli]|uniref:C-type cytochrome n=1 Tax=Flaviaesturariibacter aridisoli TaxID=2545761 RepID=A0A4R4E3I9_9BACT|nr:c-type cytochrome [Flaviaesturariibacter aridisoli]TCZ70580.1 c-type cytochrome [Flaviaesturariibacter aridisoli]
MKKTLILLTCLALMAFGYYGLNDGPVQIPPSKQRGGGDPKKGFQYLVYGDYVRSGLPINVFRMGFTRFDSSLLPRTGINSNIPYDFNALRQKNGQVIVAPNCLQCHAMPFEGKLVMGLGNAGVDFTKSRGINAGSVSMIERILKLNSPEDYEAARTFLTVTKTIAPDLVADVRGVNLADHLAALLVAHRDPVTFRWSDTALMEKNHAVIPTDTPPWWLLKKKNAMFYNGFGRGDFGRFLMASNLLTTGDTAESRVVDEQMPDLLAYIYSLKAPAYPKAIDRPLAAKGKPLFEARCASCHGTYGPKGSYPNLLIPGSIIQTDSLLYASNYSTPQFVAWFNRSWFRSGDHPAELAPSNGYVAPPLDGIWISAPYLHNGSVPTLEALLNSRLRPRYWSRDFKRPQYNYGNPGWVYKEESAGGKPDIYNTDLTGYSNRGHYFGDALTDAERKAVIEYLKTL